MARKNKPIRSDIAWRTPDRIEVHGKSLPDEILGHINLGDMAFLQIVGRMPTPQESNVFNAIAVTLVEHGITPSALVARLTYAGAPESLQAAVAAGLCGLFWGLLYMRTRSVWPGLVSHALWDLVIFVLAPVG